MNHRYGSIPQRHIVVKETSKSDILSVATGVAMGTAIGHAIATSSASRSQHKPCEPQEQAFFQCTQANPGQLALCQEAFEQFDKCRRGI
jgi:hypothetical protein